MHDAAPTSAAVEGSASAGRVHPNKRRLRRGVGAVGPPQPSPLPSARASAAVAAAVGASTKRRRTMGYSAAAETVQAAAAAAPVAAALEEAKASESEVALPLPSTPLKHPPPSKKPPQPPPPEPEPEPESATTAVSTPLIDRPIGAPSAPPAVLHTGTAAARIVASWFAGPIGEAPAWPDAQANPTPEEVADGEQRAGMLEEVGRLEWAMASLAAVLGATGVGDAGMVTQKLAQFLPDRRTGVAHAAGRALLGMVQAAGGRVSTLARLLVGTSEAAGEEEEEVPLTLVCRKLGDYRPEWRCWALELLLDALPPAAQAGLLSPAQRAAVVGMLADPNREARHLAAGVLGSPERKDTAALFLGDASDVHVKAVVELLNETRLSMRAAAVQMLALLPPVTQPTILRLVGAKLASTVRGTRFFALDALRCGLPLPFGHEPNNDAQRLCLRHVLRRLGDPAPCVRRAAAAVLVGLPLPALAHWRVVERLLALASPSSSSSCSGGDRVRSAAAALGVVARLPSALVAPHASTLCSLLTPAPATTNPDIRKAALQALGQLSSPALAPFVVPCILPFLSREQEPNALVRRAAIVALQHHDIDATAPVLADLVRGLEGDPADACRLACATTLATLDPPAETIAPFQDALLRRLLAEDEAPPVRLASLKALARLPLSSLREVAAGTSTSTSSDGGRSPLEIVAEAGASHEAPAIRAAAIDLLACLPLDTGAGPFLDVVVPRALQRSEPCGRVRARALEALLGLPPPLLSAALVRAVRAAARIDSEARVREAAARALRLWGETSSG